MGSNDAREMLEVAKAENVKLAAVIEQAKAHLRVVEGADVDILHGRPVMDAAEERALALRLLGDALDSADAGAALVEWQASRPVTNAEVEAAYLGWRTAMLGGAPTAWEHEATRSNTEVGWMRAALEAARKTTGGGPTNG